jgi:hypothetical protein
MSEARLKEMLEVARAERVAQQAQWTKVPYGTRASTLFPNIDWTPEELAVFDLKTLPPPADAPPARTGTPTPFEVWERLPYMPEGPASMPAQSVIDAYRQAFAGKTGETIKLYWGNEVFKEIPATTTGLREAFNYLGIAPMETIDFYGGRVATTIVTGKGIPITFTGYGVSIPSTATMTANQFRWLAGLPALSAVASQYIYNPSTGNYDAKTPLPTVITKPNIIPSPAITPVTPAQPGTITAPTQAPVQAPLQVPAPTPAPVPIAAPVVAPTPIQAPQLAPTPAPTAVTSQPPVTPPPVSPIPTPPPPPPPFIPWILRDDEIKKGKEVAKVPPAGTIAWKQGLFWIMMPPPYTKRYYSKTSPTGTYKFATGEGSAYATIQSIGGIPTKDVRGIDIGIAIVDITKRDKQLKIQFKQDAEDAYRGRSALETISVVRSPTKVKVPKFNKDENGRITLAEKPKRVPKEVEPKKSIVKKVEPVSPDIGEDTYFGHKLRPPELRINI